MVRPSWRRARPTQPFLQLKNQDLDLLKPPPYDLNPDRQGELRGRVEELVDMLVPGAVDTDSGDVLSNYINDWADGELEMIVAERDERLAVADALIGLAEEAVARYQPQYLADLDTFAHTKTAVVAAYETLTGKKMTEMVVPNQRRPSESPIESTLGPVVLDDDDDLDEGDDWTDPTRRRGTDHDHH